MEYPVGKHHGTKSKSMNGEIQLDLGGKRERTRVRTIYHPETLEGSVRSMSGRKIACRKHESNAQVCRPGHQSSWQMGREEEGTLAANLPTPALSSLCSPPRLADVPVYVQRSHRTSGHLQYSNAGVGSYRSSMYLADSLIRIPNTQTRQPNTLRTRGVRYPKAVLFPPRSATSDKKERVR